MQPPPSGASGDFPPILAYKAPSGRLFTRDRVQNSSGDWETTETDVTMAQPAFALDFGRLEVGWCHFAYGAAPLWTMVPYGHPMPDRPPSPGKDAKGKDIQYKNGFRLPVAGNAIGGVRELAGNSNVLITAMNEVHTLFEAAPEAAMGKIPVVKMTDIVTVKVGQATNFQPVFSIFGWVDRPDVLGPRTVTPPRATTPGNAAPRTAQVADVPRPAQTSAAKPEGMPF